jgi:hypothetical protein
VKAREIFEYNRLTWPEKGRQIAEAIMKGMLVCLDEFRAWPIEGRQDQHRLPVQREIRW